MTATAKKAKTSTSRKATPKKTTATPIDPLVLTKPATGEEKKKSERLSVGGFETTVALMRSKQKQLDELTEFLQKEKEKMTEIVSSHRLAAEIGGNFCKTVILPSADDEEAMVIFQNKFSKIDTKHEAALKKGLNGHYEDLVSRGFELKVKSDATLKALRAALGEKFEALQGFVDVNEFLKISGDFMETRAGLRPCLTVEENAACDAITAQCQCAPQIRLK